MFYQTMTPEVTSQIAHAKAINEAVKLDPDYENDPGRRSLVAFPDLTDHDRIILVLTASEGIDFEKYLCDWIWPVVEQPQWHIERRTTGSVEAAKDEGGWWFPHLFPENEVVVGKDAEGENVIQWVMPLLRGAIKESFTKVYDASNK